MKTKRDVYLRDYNWCVCERQTERDKVKAKSSSCIIKQDAIYADDGVEVQLHAFLTSATD
jgi:hypothetical protein